ncbi:accessory gene regulator ArgB-like protein [Clostridium peptidivorans]|uniref:accessory gene regulator ArgB-like protein n=1 Tax=Clostridium peptidivorans TaxID=100174 RepID=UPI000BE3717A|nr:accessory gene regulator B family protein [Clostridium peptidivorans]
MENLSNSIANKVAAELNMDNDKKEVIAYGAFALLQTFFSILLVSIFGFIFHVAIEALIVLFTASILRKYSGGAHASSPGNCTSIGVIICIGQALLISFIVNVWLNFKIALTLELMALVWSYYMIYKLAPVDNPSKRIKSEEKRKRMKKGSFIILSIYFIIVIFIMILYFNIKKTALLVYALCIIGGIVWQVFTLTKSGHLTLAKIDIFLKYLLNIKKEVKIK